MRTIVSVTLVALLLAAFGLRTARAACVTFYDGAAPVNCTAVAGSGWVAVGPPGQLLLFKNIYGLQTGTNRYNAVGQSQPPKGPTRAGVGLAGPLCWTGALPTLTLTTTDPPDWRVPADTEWQAVKRGGFCQLCCTSQF